MAENKTVETKQSIADFLLTIKDEKKRQDCSQLIKLIKKETGLTPKMWGTSIVGFGKYHYKYESGREGDAPLTGIASRAKTITLYLGTKFEKSEELFSKLGKYKLSGGCVHIQKLEDVDLKILVKMFINSIEHRRKIYPE